MEKVYQSRIGENKIKCTICGCDRFTTKNFKVAGSLLQSFNWEMWADEGKMLICIKCSHILYFAKENVVILSEVTKGT